MADPAPPHQRGPRPPSIPSGVLSAAPSEAGTAVPSPTRSRTVSILAPHLNLTPPPPQLIPHHGNHGGNAVALATRSDGANSGDGSGWSFFRRPQGAGAMGRNRGPPLPATAAAASGAGHPLTEAELLALARAKERALAAARAAEETRAAKLRRARDALARAAAALESGAAGATASAATAGAAAGAAGAAAADRRLSASRSVRPGKIDAAFGQAPVLLPPHVAALLENRCFATAVCEAIDVATDVLMRRVPSSAFAGEPTMRGERRAAGLSGGAGFVAASGSVTAGPLLPHTTRALFGSMHDVSGSTGSRALVVAEANAEGNPSNGHARAHAPNRGGITEAVAAVALQRGLWCSMTEPAPFPPPLHCRPSARTDHRERQPRRGRVTSVATVDDATGGEYGTADLAASATMVAGSEAFKSAAFFAPATGLGAWATRSEGGGSGGTGGATEGDNSGGGHEHVGFMPGVIEETRTALAPHWVAFLLSLSTLSPGVRSRAVAAAPALLARAVLDVMRSLRRPIDAKAAKRMARANSIANDGSLRTPMGTAAGSASRKSSSRSDAIRGDSGSARGDGGDGTDGSDASDGSDDSAAHRGVSVASGSGSRSRSGSPGLDVTSSVIVSKKDELRVTFQVEQRRLAVFHEALAQLHCALVFCLTGMDATANIPTPEPNLASVRPSATPLTATVGAATASGPDWAAGAAPSGSGGATHPVGGASGGATLPPPKPPAQFPWQRARPLAVVPLLHTDERGNSLLPAPSAPATIASRRVAGVLAGGSAAAALGLASTGVSAQTPGATVGLVPLGGAQSGMPGDATPVAGVPLLLPGEPGWSAEHYFGRQQGVANGGLPSACAALSDDLLPSALAAALRNVQRGGGGGGGDDRHLAGRVKHGGTATGGGHDTANAHGPPLPPQRQRGAAAGVAAMGEGGADTHASYAPTPAAQLAPYLAAAMATMAPGKGNSGGSGGAAPRAKGPGVSLLPPGLALFVLGDTMRDPTAAANHAAASGAAMASTSNGGLHATISATAGAHFFATGVAPAVCTSMAAPDLTTGEAPPLFFPVPPPAGAVTAALARAEAVANVQPDDARLLQDLSVVFGRSNYAHSGSSGGRGGVGFGSSAGSASARQRAAEAAEAAALRMERATASARLRSPVVARFLAVQQQTLPARSAQWYELGRAPRLSFGSAQATAAAAQRQCRAAFNVHQLSPCVAQQLASPRHDLDAQEAQGRVDERAQLERDVQAIAEGKPFSSSANHGSSGRNSNDATEEKSGVESTRQEGDVTRRRNVAVHSRPAHLIHWLY